MAFCRRISLLQLCRKLFLLLLLLLTFENEMSVPNDKISKRFAARLQGQRVLVFCVCVFLLLLPCFLLVWLKFIFINTSVCQMRLSYVKQASVRAKSKTGKTKATSIHKVLIFLT